jgi:hypothetical protein
MSAKKKRFEQVSIVFFVSLQRIKGKWLWQIFAAWHPWWLNAYL